MTKATLNNGEVYATTRPQEKASNEAQATAILNQTKLQKVIKDVKEIENDNAILTDALKRKRIEIIEKNEQLKNKDAELRQLRVDLLKLQKKNKELESTSTKALPKKSAELQEIIKTQKLAFCKIVNKDFLSDIQRIEKSNKNKGFVVTNYFNELFILTYFKEQKNTYTFKSYFEKLFFDTLYFKYQNQKADSLIQAEYIEDNENKIRFAVFSENMTPQQIEFYNRVYDLNIPKNAKADEQAQQEEQNQLDYNMF